MAPVVCPEPKFQLESSAYCHPSSTQDDFPAPKYSRVSVRFSVGYSVGNLPTGRSGHGASLIGRKALLKRVGIPPDHGGISTIGKGSLWRGHQQLACQPVSGPGRPTLAQGQRPLSKALPPAKRKGRGSAHCHWYPRSHDRQFIPCGMDD